MPKFEWTEGEFKLANMFARSIPAKDWICRAPGRADHHRVLYRHPLTGLRKLRCPTCDNDEVVRWLAGPGDAGHAEVCQLDGERDDEDAEYAKRRYKRATPLPHTMTLEQLLNALTDTIRSLTPLERKGMRRILEREFELAERKPNYDVLDLTDADWQLLRELKVKP